MRTVVFLVLLTATLQPLTASTAEPDADKAMARRISSHIQQSGQLRNYRIGVTCRDGIAVLAGTVASAEQRDAAVRLAEQISGVSHVDCSLEISADEASAGQDNDPRSRHAPFAGSQTGGDDSLPSDVVQAYGQNGLAQAAPIPRSPAALRNGPPRRAPRPMPRGNMPLPAPRYASDPAIRQASAQGVYPAGGPFPVENYGNYGGPMGPEMSGPGGGMGMQAAPVGFVPNAYGRGPSYENAAMPGYAWPSYASYPNYAALTYPQQYSPTAWPYIGPFYPYPQVPLAWRKVSLEWDDGWWFLDFSAHNSSH